MPQDRGLTPFSLANMTRQSIVAEKPRRQLAPRNTPAPITKPRGGDGTNAFPRRFGAVQRKGNSTTMRIALAILLPIALAGCLSFSSSDPPPPRTVYVPVPAPAPAPAP
jgi:hypothetical protein